MSFWRNLFDNLDKEVVCPRCEGKGQMDVNDIIRLRRGLIWSPGPCSYCNETGIVTKRQIRKIKVDDPIFPLELDFDEKSKQAYIKRLEYKAIKERESKKTKIREVALITTPYNLNPTTTHKFGLHKKGFFYNDENYGEVENSNGSLLGFYQSLDEAKTALEIADLNTFLKLKGNNAVDFFLHSPNYDEVFYKLEEYYQDEFDLAIKDKYHFDLPKQMDEKQASVILRIIEFSFHTIVEYENPVNIDPNSFPEFEIGDYNEFE